MFRKSIELAGLFLFLAFSASSVFAQNGTIIDHTCTKISDIPEEAIIRAKDSLHIAYGHTSHGSQLITGMNGLDAFMGGTGLYVWNDGPKEGYLDLDDYFVKGDLGDPDRTTWATRTRDYLDKPENADVNVVIWSWCGQVSTSTEDDIITYLDLMSDLEKDYPNVKFVYMTGHLDGTGLDGTLHIRNDQIREYCKTHDKILYDFEDIESYDPDGTYFGDKIPNDNCDYDTNGDGTRDGNWAIEWQNSHTEGVDWYDCSPAHTQALNGNLKAYAAWYLWATLAGWSDATSVISPKNGSPETFELKPNFPNPFNPVTRIRFSVPRSLPVSITVYNAQGKTVEHLLQKTMSAGEHEIEWNAASLASGVYFIAMHAGQTTKIRKAILLK